MQQTSFSHFISWIFQIGLLLLYIGLNLRYYFEGVNTSLQCAFWQLLKEKGLLPDMSRQIDDIVFPLDEALEGPASNIASSLRKKGRAVDLVEDKRLKWYVA